MSNRQLDEGPFDPDQIHVAFGHYHVLATGYGHLFADPVLGYEGTDYRHGTPYGLIVPGAGPGLRIRTGHDGWITLNVVRRRREAVADLSAWDAVEQVTLQPAGQVRVADQLAGDRRSTSRTWPAAATPGTWRSASACAGETSRY